MDDSQSFVHYMLRIRQHIDQLDNANQIPKKSAVHSQKFRDEGNGLYRQNKHTQSQHKELIRLYTTSIAFAPKESEDLAKGFGNRSAVLMHLHRYEEALIDIDRALLITQSDDLKAKLTLRKEKCLKLKNELTDKKLSAELPKMHPSEQMPNASEAVGLAYNKKHGRHLVATRDIQPGEIIIAEKGYVCFPKEHKFYTTCSHCLKFAWNGIPCEICVSAIFCSEECKNEAMQEYHDVECSVVWLIADILDVNFTRVLAVVRSFIKAVKSEGFESVMNEVKISNETKDNVHKLLNNGYLNTAKFRPYYNLIFHTENEIHGTFHLKDDGYFHNSLMITTVLLRQTNIIPICNKLEDCDSADNELLITLSEIFTRLQHIARCNGFMYQASICECTDLDECLSVCDSGRGMLLSPTCSLVNHSCCPNVNRMFVPNGKVIMITRALVKKGQQLCDSYGPHFSSPKEERQKYLKEKYYFVCSCQACEENWPQFIEMEIAKNPITKAPTYQKFMNELQNYFPNEESFAINILALLTGELEFDDSIIDKLMLVSRLIYKHFNYRIAYYHSLKFTQSFEIAYFKFYGENSVMPDTC